jgi:citrate synthase
MIKHIDQNTKLSEVFNLSTDSDGNRDVLAFKERKNKIILFDPGLYNVALNKSNISKVNQTNGKLSYRNIFIENLVNEDFLDVAYLLMFAEPTDANHLISFKNSVHAHFKLYLEMKAVLDALPITMLPMDFLAAGILTLSGIEKNYIQSVNDHLERSAFILAQTSVIAIYYHNRYNNEPWVEVNSTPLENFAYRIIRGMNKNASQERLSKLSSILNTILIIHAEHGQNCSTATVRNIASARSSIYSALSSGIAAFKGNLHGGASQQVSEMYDYIIDNNIDFNEYINQKIQQKQPIMGFGQRTYNRISNCWDPRVEIMMKIVESKGFNFPEVERYRSLAFDMIKKVTTEEYFINRNLTPNPDLFNCIFYKLFGVHNSMNPLMITLGRVAGWMANFYEHINDQYYLTRPCDL